MLKVTQVVPGGTQINIIDPDLVERVVPLNRLTPEELKTLGAEGANALVKMQSGDTIYIVETLEWYWEQTKLG
jgi:hypothetical protein